MAKKQLSKQLRLYDIFSISTGAMFSSGFFLLPGIAAAETGPSVYLAYLVSGFLIIPAMLSVAELSTAMPKAGGAYYFLDRSLGPFVGTIGGLGSWMALMFKSVFALLGMGAYLALFINIDFTLLALILTVLFGFLNVFGAKETTFLQRLLVTILLVIMGIFVVQGLGAISGFELAETPDDYKNFFRQGLHGFISTVGLVFVSYTGLTKVASVAEEIQNPDKNIPLGMILSLVAAISIYVIGVYIMLQVLEPSEFYSSLTPVADAGATFMSWLPGSLGVVMIVVAAVAAFASTGNAGIMSASRYPFAMARDKLVSPRFAKVGRTGTPAFSVFVTASCMIVILLIFDVESVAKLASAFQLLLFGLLCLAVIVMRESKIDAYMPGFRSPFYPWIQITGMLISVWLIAEMGLLAVGFTGMIIVFCAAWYVYYAGGKLKRQGAIFHVHERLGRKRYEGLEHELLTIVNEKNTEKGLAYEEIVARSVIIDAITGVEDMHQLYNRSADILSGRLKIEKYLIEQKLLNNHKHEFTRLSNGVLISYANFEDIDTAEMVVFRLGGNIEVKNKSSMGEGGNALIFLAVPDSEPGLDMRLVGHIAEIVQQENFVNRWMQAESEKEIREILISDEHFIHLDVRENEYFRKHVGKRVSDIVLPGDCLITIIYRKGDILIPHGNTEIESDDELSIIGSPDDIRTLNDRNLTTVQ